VVKVFIRAKVLEAGNSTTTSRDGARARRETPRHEGENGSLQILGVLVSWWLKLLSFLKNLSPNDCRALTAFKNEQLPNFVISAIISK
jgi:hypothetical protein